MGLEFSSLASRRCSGHFIQVLERDIKISLLSCSLANRLDGFGAVGPVLSISGFAEKSWVHLSDGTILTGVHVATVSNGRAVALGHPRDMPLWFDVTLKAHNGPSTSLIIPLPAGYTVPFPELRAGRSHSSCPGAGRGGAGDSTCCYDYVRPEGSQLRGCHNIPVQLGHRHPGALCVVGIMSWVPFRGSGVWFQ